MDPDEVITCLESGAIKSLQRFLDGGHGINDVIIADDDDNLCMLHIACGLDTPRRNVTVEYLLSCVGIDVNKRAGPGCDLWTSAHFAACWGHDNTLRILLAHGADPFITDSYLHNVWDIAEAFDNFACILVLERKYAMMDANLDLNEDIEEATQYLSAIDISEKNGKENILAKDISVINISDDTSTILADSCNSSLASLNQSITRKLHRDKKFGVSFLEVSFAVKKKDEVPSDEDEPVAKGPATLDETVQMLSNDELYAGLVKLGQSPGPVTATTENVYRRQFQHLRKRINFLPESPGKSLPLPLYPHQINAIVQGSFNYDEAKRLELDFIQHFRNQGPSPKTYFTYILLDPRVTNNLPAECLDGDALLCGKLFKRFVEAIFYIGKGTGNRPYMHLYDADLFAKSQPRGLRKSSSRKIARIIDIWSQGYGVISLHCFLSVSSNEALARECFMIEALGIKNLTNIQIGQNRARDLKWTEHKKRLLGTYLLYKAYKLFLLDGEKQVKRGDVQK